MQSCQYAHIDEDRVNTTLTLQNYQSVAKAKKCASLQTLSQFHTIRKSFKRLWLVFGHTLLLTRGRPVLSKRVDPDSGTSTCFGHSTITSSGFELRGRRVWSTCVVMAVGEINWEPSKSWYHRVMLGCWKSEPLTLRRWLSICCASSRPIFFFKDNK